MRSRATPLASFESLSAFSSFSSFSSFWPFAVLALLALLALPGASAVWLTSFDEPDALEPDIPAGGGLLIQVPCHERAQAPSQRTVFLEANAGDDNLELTLPSSVSLRGASCNPLALEGLGFGWSVLGSPQVPAETPIPLTFTATFGGASSTYETTVEMAYAGELIVTPRETQQSGRTGDTITYLVEVENKANTASMVTFEAQRTLAGTIVTPEPRLLARAGEKGSTATMEIQFHSPDEAVRDILFVNAYASSAGRNTSLGAPTSIELVASTKPSILPAVGVAGIMGTAALAGIMRGKRAQ